MLLSSFHVLGISRPYETSTQVSFLEPGWRCPIICPHADSRFKKSQRLYRAGGIPEPVGEGFTAAVGQVPGPMTEAMQGGSLWATSWLQGERRAGFSTRRCVSGSSVIPNQSRRMLTSSFLLPGYGEVVRFCYYSVVSQISTFPDSTSKQGKAPAPLRSSVNMPRPRPSL